MPESPRERLRVYLNDHLAGASGGSELARRLARRYPNGDLGMFLYQLAEDVEADRQELKRIMERVGAPENRPKQAVSWLLEKAGRLKPNLNLTGQSPLSRLHELEMMRLGVEGKLALWRSLEAAGLNGDTADLARLAARAEEQRDGLEHHRRAAAAELLS